MAELVGPNGPLGIRPGDLAIVLSPSDGRRTYWIMRTVEEGDGSEGGSGLGTLSTVLEPSDVCLLHKYLDSCADADSTATSSSSTSHECSGSDGPTVDPHEGRSVSVNLHFDHDYRGVPLLAAKLLGQVDW